ncbi:hypothetical protein [Pyramidobacter piscolens]|uniref:hypothetical protein n=1 Tax=Pyramidobacter piscolens TaxID=638849 RepID=UPI002AAFE118|nr:hypothetical protein [Pyramidobacter piscolens]
MPKIIDLTGWRFGRLVVLRLADDQTKTPQDTTARWLCQCDCGNVVVRSRKLLRSGCVNSCGCLARDTGNRLKDLTGQRFGRLTVLRRADNAKSGNARWLCRCDCGRTSIATGTALRTGKIQSCGCMAQDIRYSRRTDLTGQRFGRLVAIEYVKDANGDTSWRCRCDCGKETVVTAGNLINGNTHSCGCLAQDMGRANVPLMLDAALRDGTNVQVLSKKTKSKLGVRGVYEVKDKECPYEAKLILRKETLLRKRFKTFAEAVAARESAEEKYLAPLARKWAAEDKKRRAKNARTKKRH